MAYTKYSLTPADNNAAPPNGAPEGMLPSGVNDTMRDMMSQIRDVGDGVRDGTYTMTAPVITGGSVSGITDLAIADGGTGASTAADARVNLGVDNYGNNKNRIINGAMVIDQRNAGASVTANNGVFGVDRFAFTMVASSKGTAQQSSVAPSGFINSLLFTSSAATSVSSSDYYSLFQRIEGFNVADLGWGTANAKTVTLSFWVRSSLTGTFGGAITNSAFNRSYPFTYTINSANTFEYKTITIAGDTTGTWLTNNGIGMLVQFGLGVGSTFSGTAGAWSASGLISATGATSVVGTSGATFYITAVQLEVGTQATSFEYRQYQQELALCQRYYVKFATPSGSQFLSCGQSISATQARFPFSIPCPLRATPSINFSGIGINDTSVQNAVTAIGTIGTSTSNVSFVATCGSGLTAIRPVILASSGVATDYIDFSSEL